MKKILIALAMAAGIFAILWKINADTTWAVGMTLTADPCETGGGCYVFTVNDTVAYAPGYSYFWFFDDGSFAITRGNTVSHTFQRFYNSTGTGTRNVHVEVTKLYEKGDKPIALPIEGGGGVTINTTFEIDEPLTAGQELLIIGNRTPVPGDTITYVVTYGKLCEVDKEPLYIKLFYDVDELTLVEAKTRGFHQENVSTPPANGEFIIGIAGANLDDDLTRRVFVTFAVDPEVDAEGGQMVGISGDIYFEEDQSCLNEPETFVEVAALSHDPNFIVANTESLCAQVSNGDKITYTVHFQNLGHGPATDVEVRSYLPLFFSDGTVFTTFSDGSTENPTPVNNGEMVWSLTGSKLNGNASLRGTGEPGYGTIFSVEDTKDSIQFTVEFDDAAFQANGMNFDPCLAIINRAEIVFDCNPSIFTNFSETIISCQGSMPLANCTCDTLFGVFVNLNQVKYLGTPLTLDAKGPGDGLVWYPPVFLSNYFDNNPTTVSPTRSTEYMAAIRGSGGCNYTLTQTNLEMKCDLSISAKIKYTECKNGVKANILATAVTGANPADLVWNWECSDPDIWEENGKRFCLENRPPGVYHLTVKNTVTGCWAQETVVVANTCPKTGFSMRTALIAVGVLVGLILLFRIFRAKKK